MLKAAGLRALFALAAALAFLCPGSRVSAEALPAPADLLTGSVRDQNGAVVAARVAVRDAKGGLVGTASTGRDGTFAALLTGPAAEVRVECAHCAPLRASVAGGPLVLVVTRFVALSGELPDGADLAALPYRDPAQALALAPYDTAIQSPGGRVASLSDRGLESGDGLILDNGVPAYDPASADPGLFAFPGRSLAGATAQPPARAFAYGSYAGGGTFALDSFGDDPAQTVAFDSGQGFALATRLRAGNVQAGLAGSNDLDGVLRERVDVAVAGEVGGGTLRAIASLASQSVDDLADADDRSRALLGLAYSRLSQRAQTDVAFDALEAHSAYASGYGDVQLATNAGALDARLRVVRPAWLTFAYGALLRRASAGYGASVYAPPASSYATELGYFEAGHGGLDPVSFDAGVGVERVASRVPGSGSGAGETVALPSLQAGTALGAGLSLHAGVSTSLRPPLPYEVPAYAAGAYALERSALDELSLDFDDLRRIRLGATLFDARVRGIAAQGGSGLGFSAAWQIAPRLSLRAWTLHDAFTTDTVALTDQPGDLGTALTRGVVWLSYAAPSGLRFDAIARSARDASGREGDLDADIVAPLPAGYALTVGSERERARRRTYLGLRIR